MSKIAPDTSDTLDIGSNSTVRSEYLSSEAYPVSSLSTAHSEVHPENSSFATHSEIQNEIFDSSILNDYSIHGKWQKKSTLILYIF